jgi:hypothetical protein
VGKHNQTERDLGFYLDEDWANRAAGVLVTPGVDYPRDEPTPMVLFPWQDYGNPLVTMRAFGQAVSWLLHKLAEGVVVETGCLGGHGRTGTLLACLLVKQGSEARAAIERVRLTYCDYAIEGSNQEHFVIQFHAFVNGLAIPERQPFGGHGVSMIDNATTVGNNLSGGWRAWDEQDAEYERWLEERTAAYSSLGANAVSDVARTWDEIVVDADCALPDGWEYWEDERIEEYLAAQGYNVMTTTVSDDGPQCSEAPCPHPASCDDMCLRTWLSEAREGTV